jgi:acetylornithine deacetylase/succinyl-diaminopimelate desuccinylase-like protein
MDHQERVLDYIDSHRDEVISFMRRLLQTRSVTGDESAIGALVAAECAADGLEVELVEPEERRVSVVARYHGTKGSPKVMMYSHYDTVPPGDLDTWTHPPFSAEIADGWIWGRGACDNKIATCGLTMAFRAINSLGIRLRGDIVFTHVGDEERGGLYGFQTILDKGYGEGVDYLFYAHGGSGEQIGIAANGSRGCSITVKGRSAHTARLEQGVNAVVKAARLVTHLQELANEVNKREYHLPGTDTVMKSRFSINKCVGFVAHNNVPDSCEILVDRRYTPGETEGQIDREFNGVMEAMKAEDPEFDAEFVISSGNKLSVASADSEIVKSIQRSAEKVIGFTPMPAGGSHSSDHGWFVARHGKPFASYGIGGVGTHSANERIEVEDVILTTKVYALAMLDLLGAE